jgi:L-alanine-DL-glutamate epimerase-like enolase superfamily enzyme
VSRFETAEATLLRYKLDKPVGGSGVSAVEIVLAELTDSDGASGLGFTYIIGGIGGTIVLEAARCQLQRHVLHQPVLPPPVLWRSITAGFNRTGYGPNMVALAAIDVAAWDLEAKRRGVSLGVAMGGGPRPVPVYGSGGFTANQTPEEAAQTAASHMGRGLRGVKPRVAGRSADLRVMAAVRDVLEPHVDLMLDANEKCDRVSAQWLLAAARDHGALFVEEPLRAEDVEGYRALAQSGGAAMAAGEHLQGRAAFLPFIAERLVGLIQPDLAMAGGLTPALEIASLAEALGVSVAPHFLPGLFVHLAAARPAVTWLEEFPLIEPLFEGWPETGPEGTLEPGGDPGHGLLVAPGVRERFAASGKS